MPTPTWNGQQLVHPDYSDHYGLDGGGLSEAAHVFIDSTRLPERFAALAPTQTFTAAELGLGPGRNLLALWTCFERHATPTARLHVHTFESHPPQWNDVYEAILAMWNRTPTPLQERFDGLLDRLERLRDTWPTALPGVSQLDTGTDRVRVTAWVGPAERTLPWADFTADHWLLDGFSPAINPALWSPDLLREVGAHTKAGGTLATYTAAGRVRRALDAAGFSVQRVPGHGRKRQMLVADKTTEASMGAVDQRYPWSAPRDLGQIAVVGAGIAGTSIARRLAEEGFQVTVLEAEAPGAGASGNPWGLLQPLPNLGHSPVGDWTTRGFAWTRAWARRRGLPFEPLSVARYGPADRLAYARRLRESLPWGDVLEDGESIQDAPPGAVLGIRTAALAQPRVWCAQLMDHPRIHLQGGQVVQLSRSGPRWQLTLADGAVFTADTVVLANSTQARELLPALDLHPVRGQLVQLAQTPHSATQTRALCGSIYLLPARDGAHVLGATYDRDDPDPMVREADTQALLAELNGVTTALGSHPEVVDARVSWRGVTPGRLPFVGPVDDPAMVAAGLSPRKSARPLFAASALQAGLWVSAGHGSRGLCGGPLAAHVLVEAMLGRRPPLPPATLDAVHPSRVTVARVRRRTSGAHKTPSPKETPTEAKTESPTR